MACLPSTGSPSAIGPVNSAFNEARDGYKNNNNKQVSLKDDCVMSSNHRCCAERRWLDACVKEARKNGVAPHKTAAYIRRKFGSRISVFRFRHDGSFGCTVPCVWCQKELERFDITVSFVDDSGRWCDGRVSDGTLPKPVLTAGQRRMLNK
jgi:hypothetical protein